MNYLRWLIALLFSALLIWLAVGVGFGTWELPHTLEAMILEIRLPRVATALLVGAALSASGAALQALFENPLADPSLIGTSGGAALGVISVLAFGFSGIGVPLAAFLGAVGVCLLILGVHRIVGGGTFGLLIMGLIISAFCAAAVSMILFLSDDLVLRSATVWLAGSLAEAGFTPLHYPLAVIIAGLLLLSLIGRRLDCLMLGEDTAVSMGISVGATRVLTVIATALLTGAAVSLSGVIGFLGMMIPNLVSHIVGGNRRKIVLLSAWFGSLFLLSVDSVARWAAYPVDLPVGIIISLLGGPFFLWLFIQNMRAKAA